MTITAKYAGFCSVCGQSVKVGERVEWKKGEGSTHERCVGKTPAPLNSKPPEQMISADSDLIALAAKYGRVLDGEPKLHSMMTSGSAKVGEIEIAHRKDGSTVRRLYLAVGKPRYYSADFLEDMDMFSMRPGRYSDVQYVLAQATEAEIAEEARHEEERAAKLIARIKGDGEIIPCLRAPGIFLRVSGRPERQAYIRAVAERAPIAHGWLWMQDKDDTTQYDAEFLRVLRAYWDVVAPGWTHRNGVAEPDSTLIDMHAHSGIQHHLEGEHVSDLDSAVIDVPRLERVHKLSGLANALGMLAQ